jgi:hypothetical protein
MSHADLPDDMEELRWNLGVLQRQIPEMKKDAMARRLRLAQKDLDFADPPELSRLITKRDAILAKLAVLEPPTPTAAPSKQKPKSRGRTAGVDKISEAITVLNARIKDRESTDITSIAKQVGCTPKNLRKSKRFMNAYKLLTGAMRKTDHYRGTKTNGHIEAYLDTRVDSD